MEEMYYVQDARQYVGNDILWWGVNGSGYTCNIDKAGKYTKEKAFEMNRDRDTDVPWPVSYIDERISRHVDAQHTNKAIALGADVELLNVPQKPKKQTFKCEDCGLFMTEEAYHTEPCKRCGSSF